MFTGIITDIGEVIDVQERTDLRRFRIACTYEPEGIALGASIACSGPCLTVTARGADGRNWFEVEAAAETLALTTAGAWRTGTRLNLERALRIGDELGGHLVTGHVDGTARLAAVEEVTAAETGWGATRRLLVDLPQAHARYVAAKGSITLDGVSLTVNTVEDARLSVLIIPHTLAATTLGERIAGDRLNFEVDLMARYAARLSEARPA